MTRTSLKDRVDPGCVKTLRGITAPGILGSAVMRNDAIDPVRRHWGRANSFWGENDHPTPISPGSNPCSNPITRSAVGVVLGVRGQCDDRISSNEIGDLAIATSPAQQPASRSSGSMTRFRQTLRKAAYRSAKA